jgi:mycothiol synthase
LDSPAAHFLRHHDFFIEHEEWLLRISDLTGLPTAVPPPACRVHTYQSRPATIRQFRALYNQSFGSRPWYQPYSRAEVKETLDKSTDILFLHKANRPIGFAWLQGESIEPIGIVREEQGRGYGRFILLAALHELQRRGQTQAAIGLWRNNRAALRLYQSLGFQHQQTIVYLAFDMRQAG